MPGGIRLIAQDPADITTPPADTVTIFPDSTNSNIPSYKDETGTTTEFTGSTGATGATGATGPAGPGVPATVTTHGSMGAAETFDYDGGDGSAHSGTVNAALTVTLTGWAASGNESIMSLYLTTDGTGGYGAPTWPGAVVNDADYAPFWDDAAGAFNIIRLWTIDGGTTVYIALGEAAPTLDASLAESSGEDIADALTGAAAPDAGNVFATMADVSGGGYIGTRTEATLGADVTFATGDVFVDGPTLTPAAGTYDVWARVTVKDGGAGGNNYTARLIANGSATPIDEIEEDLTGVNTFLHTFVLSARVVANGTDPIKVSAASGLVGGSGYLMKRDPANNSSGIHRATILVLTRAS